MAATSLDRPARQPLADVWSKDDDELDLEQQLFGTRKKRKIARTIKPAKFEEVTGLAHLDDQALFSIDAPIASNGADNSDEEVDGVEIDVDGAESPASSESQSDFDDDGDADTHEGSIATEQGDQQDGGDSDGETDSDVNIILPEDQYDFDPEAEEKARLATQKRMKPAVWHDPSDDLIGLDLDEIKRLNKLARGKKSSKVRGAELERRLRDQFERLHPRPDWANGRLRTGVPSLSSLFASTTSFIDNGTAAVGSSRPPLPQAKLEIQRVRNANQANPTAGKREAQGAGSGVVDFVWHPSPRVPVGVVAGGDRRIRFFNIDGHANPTLLTLHIPSLPLTKTSFHPSGSSLFIAGTRPFYYTYDLASQKCLRSPRNLFGSRVSPLAPQSLTTHAFSPDGSLLAVAGLRGTVSILDWSTTGTGAVVAELKSGRGGKTADLVWSADGTELEVLGGRDGAEVEVWNVGQRQIVRKWSDDRAYGGAIIKRSRGGEFTAIGSSTGIVNVYSGSSLTASRSKSQDISSIPTLQPQPLKSLEHLTTAITSMDFHPSGEIIVNASTGKRDALKLYHLPSATAFSNWPTQTSALGRITTTAFSSSGEYLAVGNQRGNVLLWNLKHFSR